MVFIEYLLYSKQNIDEMKSQRERQSENQQVETLRKRVLLGRSIVGDRRYSVDAGEGRRANQNNEAESPVRC